jgi:hypothetical protein
MKKMLILAVLPLFAVTARADSVGATAALACTTSNCPIGSTVSTSFQDFIFSPTGPHTFGMAFIEGDVFAPNLIANGPPFAAPFELVQSDLSLMKVTWGRYNPFTEEFPVSITFRGIPIGFGEGNGPIYVHEQGFYSTVTGEAVVPMEGSHKSCKDDGFCDFVLTFVDGAGDFNNCQLSGHCPVSTPEPGSLALLLAGLASVASFVPRSGLGGCGW